ncbi:hypothetical protein ANN_13159, partial [Periplaneta americana]
MTLTGTTDVKESYYTMIASILLLHERLNLHQTLSLASWLQAP